MTLREQQEQIVALAEHIEGMWPHGNDAAGCAKRIRELAVAALQALDEAPIRTGYRPDYTCTRLVPDPAPPTENT